MREMLTEEEIMVGWAMLSWPMKIVYVFLGLLNVLALAALVTGGITW